MLTVLACLLATAAAAPATYDQRQEGDFNLRADVQNVVLLAAVPEKLSIPFSPLSIFELKLFDKSNREAAQDRSDVQKMEMFLEPSTPYRVEIGAADSERSEGDGRAVVIAGRRRSDVEPQAERDELKLLGATEQCGPEHERDPVTLTCRPMSKLVPVETPEVVPASS